MSTPQVPPAIEPIIITVTAYYVGEMGNTPSGKFLIRFSEDVVCARHTNTAICYILSDDSYYERGIRFDNFFASDSGGQLKRHKSMENDAEPGKMIALIHANTTSMLLNVMLEVYVHNKAGQRGGIDPQITNVPQPR